MANPFTMTADDYMSFSDALRASQTKSGKEIIASTTEVKKEKIPKWRRDLKKLDGQNSSGKGGGRLAGAAGVIDKFQGMREQAKCKGDDNPDPVRPGESKDPYTVTDEGYSGGMKSSEGPQTTLLRGIETEPKKKKKNKNYEDY